MSEQLQPTGNDMLDEESIAERGRIEKQEQVAEMREHIQQAINKFNELVDQAMDNQTSEFRFTDEHGPTFQRVFRNLVKKNNVPGLEIFCHDPETDNHFQFLYNQAEENPNFKFS